MYETKIYNWKWGTSGHLLNLENPGTVLQALYHTPYITFVKLRG